MDKTTGNYKVTTGLPKTLAELRTDVFTTARAIVDHCDTAPGKPKDRFAYLVDVGLVLELKGALKAVEKVEKMEKVKTTAKD